MPIYIYILCNATYFPHFQKWPLWGTQGKLVFKISQKDKGRIFTVLMASSFKTILQTYSDIRIFCSVIQYIVSKKHEVSGDSSEIIFDEAHFIVNLQSFLQPLALPWHTFPQIESFVPHSPRQNNFQNSSPLDTSETALVCIFSSILNHS